MRGLISKDLRLTVKRKQSLIIFGVMALVMGFAMEGTFIIGYLTMLAAIVAIGTISYDEYDNGYAFLMTLPVERKTYVLEKYLFCALMSAGAWCVSVVIYSVVGLIKHAPVNVIGEFPMLFSHLPVMLLLTTVIIPLQLKYGAEKSRIAIFVIYGGIAALFILAMKLINSSNLNVNQAVSKLDTLPPFLVLMAIAAVCAAVMVISYLISVRIMEKKEF